jgi:hypothetical protein
MTRRVDDFLHIILYWGCSHSKILGELFYVPPELLRVENRELHSPKT